MSCYEWEAGSIVLPAADNTKVKKAVKAAADAHRTTLYEHAQTFWAQLPRRYRAERGRYQRAVDAYVYGRSLLPDDTGLPPWAGVGRDDQRFADDLHHLLTRVLWPPASGDGQERSVVAPRRVRRADVDFVCPAGRSANPSYGCGEATLAFNGRTAHWHVPENNHARDYAREHPVARAFFDALDHVRWTRGSGGEIVGNDEYNRDSDEAGGGANYVIDSYGPHR